MFFPFSLLLNSSAQEFAIPGGISGTAEIYISFVTAPTAGTATVEIRRPASSDWSSVQNGAAVSVTSGRVVVFADGGFNAVRVTFAGLSGGASATLVIVENPTAYIPSYLVSDGGFGPSSRVRVDPGQTGFFAGRFFRSYLSAVIPTAGPSVQFRFTSPIDFILWSQTLSLTQGAIQLQIYTGATESGTWTPIPVIGVNRMAARPTPYYTAQCTVSYGGNFTGGTEVDLIQLRSAAQNVNASNVVEQATERGLPAGAYYGRLSTLTGGVAVNDDAQLIYSVVWEERP